MKNLFILPTDKPSRLAGSEYITNEQGIDKRAFKLKLWGKIIPNKDLRDVGYIPQHIYITSDEDIKEGEYNVPSDFSSFLDISKTSKEDLQIVNEKSNGYRKIILTTDQDLIKDGVQSIDDEFLEWFVKNPSCKSVEVEKTFVTNSGLGYQEYAVLDSNFKVIEINAKIPQTSYYLDKVTILNTYEYVINYKIIIPKKEPNFYEKLVEYFKNTPREKILEDWNKTAECDNIGPTVEEFLGNTEETLEQAAIRLYPDNIIKLGNETSYNAALLKRKDFIDGGNWVKERMYSDEEIIDLLQEMNDWPTIFEGRIDIKEWFEQHKKK